MWFGGAEPPSPRFWWEEEEEEEEAKEERMRDGAVMGLSQSGIPPVSVDPTAPLRFRSLYCMYSTAGGTA